MEKRDTSKMIKIQDNRDKVLGLSQKLKGIFGERMFINSYSSFEIEGLIDEAPFSITYLDGECLIVSILKKVQYPLFLEMIKVLKGVFGNNAALCSYDYFNEEEEVMSTIEWNFSNPKQRVEKLANDQTVCNLKVYNNQNFYDFMTNSDEKIYGLYPGSLRNIKRANNLNEYELYLEIDRLASRIRRISDAQKYGKAQDVDLTEDQYALEYLVNLTRNFGIELPIPMSGRHIIPTPSYWKWIKFNDQHFKHTLTDIQWEAFQLSRLYGIDVSHFLPKGNWRDEEVKLNKIK